jgi:uncharacterized membrane protein
MKHNKAGWVFSLLVGFICIILWLLPTGFENPALTNSTIRERARVVEVDNSDLENHSLITVGTQELKLEILSGKFKGTVSEAKNVLMGMMKTDKIYKTGDKVLAVIKTQTDSAMIQGVRADDIYRIHLQLILFILFAIFLVSFAGWTGFKSLVSFVFTALVIWKVLLPLMLKGYSPVPLSLIVVACLTIVIILLITGLNKKGYVALSGAIAGLVITSLLALFFGKLFQIPGTVQEFSETLLFAGFMNLKLSDIFISCIYISAAGAVMDVAMDISAAQNEISEKRPDITPRELTLSGFRVAYPVIGTMTTTLLFAYSGSFMFIFMVFMAKGTPVVSIFNTNYIAAEILHTLVGSFGLVMVAPITAIIGGNVFVRSVQTSAIKTSAIKTSS